MKATDQLKAEHEGILLMLSILDKVCERLETKSKPAERELERIVEFLQVFADKCHHGKEEGILFPALVQAGLPGDSGPIAVMLSEHDQGRRHIRGLAGAVQRYGAGQESAIAGIVGHSRRYIALLSLHIMKENDVLFPMADQLLGDQGQEELLARFDMLETERIGPGRHDRFHDLLEELELAYLPEPVRSGGSKAREARAMR
ncbi:MAG: hemerythrin domain-containing protein [Elusimicrobia bacterium]|nr:hemerythrin domain-containing protein [Elusimicrobiota bacterium]